jgi:hypothetical protein
MAVLFSSPFLTAIDASGNVISGATLTFFLATTTTPKEVFADRGLTTTRGNVVTADSAGRFPDIWTSYTVSYRVQSKNGSGTLLRDVDYAIQATATTSSTTTTGAELKSILVNGGFDVWSLGTSFSNVGGSATLSEVADEWFASQVSTAGNSFSRQTAQSGAARYGMRFGRPSSNTTTGQIRLLQAIETGLVYRYAGKQVTISFWMTAGANFSGANVSVIVATGTAEGEALTGLPNGTWTGQSNAISVVQTPTTTATRYQFTATLAANIKEIGIQLAYTPVGTASANDWVQIENVQFEAAGLATEYSARQVNLDWLNARVAQPPTATTFRAALGSTTVGDALFVAASASSARSTLGSTTVGDALFTAASASSARTTLGSTTVGDALFVTASAAAARSTLALGSLATYSESTTITWAAPQNVGAGNEWRWFESTNNNYHGVRNNANTLSLRYNGGADYLTISNAGLVNFVTAPNMGNGTGNVGPIINGGASGSGSAYITFSANGVSKWSHGKGPGHGTDDYSITT